jgi:hypothetical protein
MKYDNAINRVLVFLLSLACGTAAQSQQATESGRAVQRVDTIFQFNRVSYHCFSSLFLSITIRRECDAYVADWRKHYGKFTVLKPESGTVILAEGQLRTLTKFAQQLSPATVHNENCNGTTYFKFTSDSFHKEDRLCDCAPNVWRELFAIIGNSRQGSIQLQP